MEKITDVKLVPLNNSQFVKPLRMQYKQNGVSKIWDLVALHESVAILIFNSERRKLVFVKQFRPAVFFSHFPESEKCIQDNSIDIEAVSSTEGITLELCAGIVDKTTDIVKTAQSEVLEECGYNVPLNKFERITSFRSGIGVSGERQTLFYTEVNDAMKVSEGGGLASEGELIDTVEITIQEVEDLLRKPEVNSPAGLLFAVMWFLHNKAPAT